MHYASLVIIVIHHKDIIRKELIFPIKTIQKNQYENWENNVTRSHVIHITTQSTHHIGVSGQSAPDQKSNRNWNNGEFMKK